MAKVNEMSTEELINAVRDVEIKEDVREDLGVHGQDPDKMVSQEGSVPTDSLEHMKPKPRDNIEAKMDAQEVNGPFEFHFAAEMLSSVKLVESDRVIAFIVEMMAKYDIKLKDIEAAGSVQPEVSSAAAAPPSASIQPEASTAIASPHSRDWRDARGNDPGYAVRQQYLHPPPHPCDPQ